MPQIKRYEQQFLDALRDIFVGAKVEGESGFINLMRIKSRYFTEGVFPHLVKDIDVACKPFEPSFREELFDKLYDFFKRYFSESGSIYFRHTPLHKNVYEKVYTDDRDVIRYLKFFTFLSRKEIAALEAKHAENPGGREAHLPVPIGKQAG